MQFISIWAADRPSGHTVPSHQHNYYELVYYVQGQGDTCVQGESYSFHESSFLLIPPGVAHDERHAKDGRVICLMFEAREILPTLCKSDPLLTVHRILGELLRESGRQPYGYREMIAAKLTELWLLIRREERAGGEEKDLEYVINFLKENYSQRILLSDCAARLHLSYDYFQHKFRRQVGMSPRRFLLLQRLEAAKRLLREGRSCTAVAYDCGFSTSAQFSALFRREYGMTPLQYRQQQKSKG